jgi:hypothetical protein
VGTGATCILQSKTAIPARSKRLTLGATVEILEGTRTALYETGVRDGYLVFGMDANTKQYYFVGPAFGVRRRQMRWTVARAKAGARSHDVLHMVETRVRFAPTMAIPSLRLEVDYQAGEVVLSEWIEGEWCEQLRYRDPKLQGLVPLAGVGVAWGETEFHDFRVSQ